MDVVDDIVDFFNPSQSNMNWENYLSENKSPSSYAHLGVIEGSIRCPFDLSELSKNAQIIEMHTPLKKFKLKYINHDSLIGHKCIEAIALNDIDEQLVNIFSTLTQLKYLHISNNKQVTIPDLSPLKSLEVLVLSGIKKIVKIDFVSNLNNLKTRYIYGINNLYDLTPLGTLTNLKELNLDHGKMSGTGTAIKSIDPLSKLNKLEYLDLSINTENRNYDISPLLELKKLKRLGVLPRYLKNGQKEMIEEQLPLVNFV